MIARFCQMRSRSTGCCMLAKRHLHIGEADLSDCVRLQHVRFKPFAAVARCSIMLSSRGRQCARYHDSSKPGWCMVMGGLATPAQC